MANRTVSVNLVANIGQYVGGMNTAAAATMRLGDSAATSTKKAQSGFDLAGKSSLLMGAAVVGGLAMAISKSMDFEKSMSAVGAATQATGATLLDLRDAAMKAGADTAYSATEAADAITEMAKAGVSAKDIMGGGLTGALSLAAAGQIDVAEAAGIASTAMTQFSLSGKDIPHVADLLAAGAGKAMGSVDDLGMALNQAGLVASASGISIEETTGTLAAFAAAGLLGSDAGTSMKTMLQKLQAPSKEAAGVMSELGINVYDANGNMLSMAGMAGQLKDHMAGLTQEQRNNALATIFGSDAVRAANVLYKEGEAGISGWTNKVNDSGYAAKQAAALQDNLAGDLEKLGGSFDTLMISIGQGLQGPFRGLVQFFGSVVDGATGLIKIFTDLPGPVQAAVGAFAAWGAIGGKVTGILGPLKQSIGGVFGSFNEALGYAQENGDGLTDVLGSVGEVGWEAAKGGLKELAKAIGPELAMAAATYLASQLVGQIVSIATAGNQAAQEVRDLNDTIRAADSNPARFDATNTGLDDMRKKLRDAQDIVDAFEGQNPFDQWVWKNPFGNEMEDAKNAKESIAHYNEEIAKLEAGNLRAEGTTKSLSDKLHLSSDEVTQLADKYGVDLSGNVDKARALFEYMYAKEYGTTPIDAADATGSAMASAKAQTEAAAKAQEDWLSNLGDIATAFVEPLGIYTGLLSTKQEAEQESAQATADSTASSSDSWKDYVGDVTVSLDEYATKLEEQLTAQDNWRTNIVKITERGGMDVGQAIADMGVEGVQLAAQMANGTDAEFQRMAELLIRDARNGGAGAAAELDTQMQVMAAIGARGAGATAVGIAQALGLGVAEVAAIAAQYGITLASGINPLLVAVGKGRIPTLNGQRVPDLWTGGYTGDGGKYEPKGVVHGGEIVWSQDDIAAHGGVSTVEEMRTSRPKGYAGGGFVTSGDVPRPYSTNPFRMPLSTGADGTMSREYDEVSAFVKAHQGGVAGSGSVGGGAWGSIWQYVKSRIPEARINSTYRAGDPGYHGLGKAIDFGFGSGAGGAGSAGLASINRLLFDGVGSNLAELIYDGIGDDRPDLKNGRPLTYNASTRAEHRNHVHAAVYDQGGPLYPGYTLAYNGTGKTEWVSKEVSGGGGAGGGGAVTVAAPIVHVTLDGRELRHTARVEAAGVVVNALTGATNRGSHNP